MGIYELKTCIFTGFDAIPFINSTDRIEYTVVVNNKKYFMSLSIDAFSWKDENNFFQKNENVFFGLLYNNDWFADERIYITLEELEKLIASKVFPQTPIEKFETLFLKLYSYHNEDGDYLNSPDNNYRHFDEFIDSILWKALYFKSHYEIDYYIDVLIEDGLIKKDKPLGSSSFEYSITFKGLNHAIKLQQNGDKSNNCFVAMSFRNETQDIRAAIKDAIKETGFIPIIVDEEFISSDRTINDEIIAGLKRCRFCIADFSYHSNGVYFESGFALGQGKKVIYTCSSSEFQNAHFDIKPLQHIIYSSTEQLKKDLINKINAWIK